MSKFAMRKLFMLFFICTSAIGNSQENKDVISQWEKFTNPSLDNVFSNHFKQYLSQDLILNADLSKRKKAIILYFNLNYLLTLLQMYL